MYGSPAGMEETMEKLLLVGAGSFGRVVLEHVEKDYDCAFLDDGDRTVVDGVPVIGKIRDLDRLYPEYTKLLVTIGNNRLREDVYRRAAAVGYTFPNLILPSAYISPHAVIGRGVIILNNAVVQNGSSIGDGTILNAGVEAHQDAWIGSNVLIYTNSVIRGNTVVGDRTWIGSTVTVSTGARVEEDAVVKDGSVVEA